MGSDAKNPPEKPATDLTLDQAFLASDILPQAADALLADVRRIDDAVTDAVIVLDTNVLLLPYGADPNSLAQIVSVYSKLKEEERLFVPAQVAREFIRNRPAKIAELLQSIRDKISKFVPPSLLHYAILEDTREFKTLSKALDKADELKKELRAAADALLDRVRGWEWDDPVSRAYKSVFDRSCVVEPQFDRAALLAEMRRRYDLSIPPGYKDASKEDGGIGDLLIWKTILEIGSSREKDLIFVSHDEKADWQHRADNTGFLPRFELVDEFRRASGGRSLYIVNLSRLLDLLKVQAPAIAEIKEEEQRIRMASAVSVECPFCGAWVDWRLSVRPGESAKPFCENCGRNFHIHRTRDSVAIRRPFQKVIEEATGGTDSRADETVTCPICGRVCTVALGLARNSTVHCPCPECDTSFPVHRRADGTVFVGSVR